MGALCNVSTLGFACSTACGKQLEQADSAQKKEELNVTSGIYHGSSKQPRSKFMNPFIIELHRRRPRTKRTNIIKRRWGCSFGIFGFADLDENVSTIDLNSSSKSLP